VKTPGIDPSQPEAFTDGEVKPTILVAVNAQNEIWIDKRPYDVGEIRPIIQSILAESPKAEAMDRVHAARRYFYGHIVLSYAGSNF